MKKLFQNLSKYLKVLFKKKNSAAEMIDNFNYLLGLNGLTLEQITKNASDKATAEDNESNELFLQGNEIYKNADAEYNREVSILDAKKAQQYEVGNNRITHSQTLAKQADKTRKALAAINIHKKG